MFSIQYEAVNGEHKMQTLETTRRAVLLKHLAQFEHPIVAVYEQASPVTKAIRKQLQDWPGAKTRHAVAFMSAMSPAST